MTSAASHRPSVGDKAPAFTLPGHSGANVKLSNLKGKWVVLYFYPKDDTPGCTIEAQQFRDHRKAFEKLGAIILGVSPDGAQSHCKFVEKYGLTFELLADEDHHTAEAYGAWIEKNRYGQKRWGIQRSTFLIDPSGKIRKVWPNVTADGHAAEVLAALTAAAKA